jgi:hypothetical protein
VIGSIGLAAAAAILAAADGTVATALARWFSLRFLADLRSLALVVIKVRAEIICCGGHALLTAAGTRRCSAGQSSQPTQQQSSASGFVCHSSHGALCCVRENQHARLAARCAIALRNRYASAPRLCAQVKQACGRCYDNTVTLSSSRIHIAYCRCLHKRSVIPQTQRASSPASSREQCNRVVGHLSLSSTLAACSRLSHKQIVVLTTCTFAWVHEADQWSSSPRPAIRPNETGQHAVVCAHRPHNLTADGPFQQRG